MDWKREIEDAITKLYDEKLEGYKFKSEEEEDNIRAMIDRCIDDVTTMLDSYEYQIDCELHASQYPDNSCDYDR